MVSDKQWLKNIEEQIPYVPNTKDKIKICPYGFHSNKNSECDCGEKLPTPKTHYKIDKIFKKK